MGSVHPLPRANVSLGDYIISAGLPLTGQRVALRLDGPVAHILADGVLARTVACPVPTEAGPRLRGARPGTAQPPRLPASLVVTRWVSVAEPSWSAARESRSAWPTPARPSR